MEIRSPRVQAEDLQDLLDSFWFALQFGMMTAHGEFRNDTVLASAADGDKPVGRLSDQISFVAKDCVQGNAGRNR